MGWCIYYSIIYTRRMANYLNAMCQKTPFFFKCAMKNITQIHWNFHIYYCKKTAIIYYVNLTQILSVIRDFWNTLYDNVKQQS